MFREFLVYHHGSLEFRAKVLTLMVSSDGEMSECEKEKLREIAHEIYRDDTERAELLIDTVKEFHHKIVTDNGLDFEHLIKQVDQEVHTVKRFCKKIDLDVLMRLHACIDEKNEEERLFQIRIIEFLEGLKKEECNA
jgi:isochorismate hydrolase